jgi:hypothetical protein
MEILVRDNVYLIDDDDFSLVCLYHWTYNKKSDRPYAVTSLLDEKGHRYTERMHRMIMRATKGQVVDHINGNVQDNRKSNLRLCSLSDNSKNKRVQSNNKSGITGVRWKPQASAWEAYIYLGHTRKKFLGYFSKLEDAIGIRKQAEYEYFREFAYSKKGDVHA